MSLIKTYGLIGFPLSHSFSQKYFTEKFAKENIKDCEYKNFSIESVSLLPAIIETTPTLCGLNVTIPHKKNVIPLLHEIDDYAQQIGAVNCIKIKSQQGKKVLSGYNTDAVGFENSLKPLLKKHHTQALILGTGGASNAIAFGLKRLNIAYQLVSRKKTDTGLTYADLSPEILNQAQLIINTTPLGTYPHTNDCPAILYQHLTPEHLLYDLTYNPEETLFLKQGKEKGAVIKNGYEMLILQAEKAWEIWNR